MNNNLNLNLTYNAWSDFLIERWRKKIHLLGIGYSQHLYESFEKELFFSAGGDMGKIDFSFAYYGKFVEMGVGKGTPLGEVSVIATDRRLIGKDTGNRRRPKKWYTSIFNTEVRKLGFIIAEKYGQKATFSIVENLKN